MQVSKVRIGFVDRLLLQDIIRDFNILVAVSRVNMRTVPVKVLQNSDVCRVSKVSLIRSCDKVLEIASV